MSNQTDQWIAAYYPLETISDRRSRAIICLLFDKVINYFPISSMSCGGGSGVSHIVLEGDILFEEDVIEAREEYLYSNIELNSSSDESWGTKEEFDKFIQLQVTAMAVDACKEEGIIPLTDNTAFQVPLSFLENFDLMRHAYLQASMLAIESMEIALPPLAGVPDEDILEAREKLKEQLIPFRRAMLSLAPAVRSGIKSGATVLDIQSEAKYIVQTQIAPALGELRDKLHKEKGKFWRRLLLKGGLIAPKFLLNYVTGGATKAALDSIGDAKDIAAGITDHKDVLASLKKNGGLGYLLAVADTPLGKQTARGHN